jgi:hypothetical protein
LANAVDKAVGQSRWADAARRPLEEPGEPLRLSLMTLSTDYSSVTTLTSNYDENQRLIFGNLPEA